MKIYKFYQIPSEERAFLIEQSKKRLKHTIQDIYDDLNYADIESRVAESYPEEDRYQLVGWTLNRKHRDYFKLGHDMSQFVEIVSDEDRNDDDTIYWLNDNRNTHLEIKSLTTNHGKIKLLLTDDDYTTATATSFDMFIYQVVEKPVFYQLDMFSEKGAKYLYQLSYDLAESLYGTDNNKPFYGIQDDLPFQEELELRDAVIPTFWYYYVSRQNVLDIEGLTKLVKILNQKTKK